MRVRILIRSTSVLISDTQNDDFGRRKVMMVMMVGVRGGVSGEGGADEAASDAADTREKRMNFPVFLFRFLFLSAQTKLQEFLFPRGLIHWKLI